MTDRILANYTQIIHKLSGITLSKQAQNLCHPCNTTSRLPFHTFAPGVQRQFILCTLYTIPICTRVCYASLLSIYTCIRSLITCDLNSGRYKQTIFCMPFATNRSRCRATMRVRVRGCVYRGHSTHASAERGGERKHSADGTAPKSDDGWWWPRGERCLAASHRSRG